MTEQQNREDQLTEVWKALEVVAQSDRDVFNEAMAGLESDDPQAFASLEGHFANEARWRG